MALLNILKLNDLVINTPAPITPAVGGDTFNPSAETEVFLRVTNAHATLTRTITFNDPTTTGPASGKAFDPDVDFVIPAASTRYIKVTRPGRFKNPVTGLVSMTYSTNADLTFDLFQ